MTNTSSISPAKYWRETQNWSKLIDQNGTVIAATLIQFGLPELSDNYPYWLLLVKSDNPNMTPSIHLYMGSDGHTFKEGDRVKCVLRRFSSHGNGLIHYGIKVIPINT